MVHIIWSPKDFTHRTIFNLFLQTFDLCLNFSILKIKIRHDIHLDREPSELEVITILDSLETN